MRASKKLDCWFWGMGMFVLLDNIAGNPERGRDLLPIMFMALFASYIAELIERQD